MKYVELLNLLPHLLQEDYNALTFKEVLRVYSDVAADIDANNVMYGDVLDIYKAMGRGLDFIGNMYAVYRKEGETDEDYRDRIMTTVASRRTPSTLPAIQETANAVLDSGYLSLWEHYEGRPANVYITGQTDDVSLARATESIKQYLPAGVELFVRLFMTSILGDDGLYYEIYYRWAEQETFDPTRDSHIVNETWHAPTKIVMTPSDGVGYNKELRCTGATNGTPRLYLADTNEVEQNNVFTTNYGMRYRLYSVNGRNIKWISEEPPVSTKAILADDAERKFMIYDRDAVELDEFLNSHISMESDEGIPVLIIMRDTNPNLPNKFIRFDREGKMYLQNTALSTSNDRYQNYTLYCENGRVIWIADEEEELNGR